MYLQAKVPQGGDVCLTKLKVYLASAARGYFPYLVFCSFNWESCVYQRRHGRGGGPYGKGNPLNQEAYIHRTRTIVLVLRISGAGAPEVFLREIFFSSSEKYFFLCL